MKHQDLLRKVNAKRPASSGEYFVETTISGHKLCQADTQSSGRLEIEEKPSDMGGINNILKAILSDGYYDYRHKRRLGL